MAATSVQAQRIGCVHNCGGTRGVTRSHLPAPYNYDPQKTYRQPVVLISFNDRDFSMSDPKEYYHRLFNEKGYNEGVGPGCVADYFRDQSSGRLNLQFDIYGPFKVNKTAGDHSADYNGLDIIMDALKLLYETETTDFSIYDWNGDGMVNQVVFVAAGYSGHQEVGYIYPFSYDIFSKLPGDIYTQFVSISCELWHDDSLFGLGHIVHEFCHCLGLPDVYPLSPATLFSAVDEWDVMDGGPFTNHGWCPPNLSTMERMYLGWDMPEELTKPTTVDKMKPLSEGGKSYIVRNSGNSNEYYLLENRSQTGWDYGCPGNGLLIYHVDFDRKAWEYNEVNTADNHYRYDLFHASNKGFRDWCPQNNDKDYTRWTEPDWLRSRYFSTSPYPYTNPTTLSVNNSLTDKSKPVAGVITRAADGRLFMGKPITNIKLADDGTISFDFMKKDDTGIETISDAESNMSDAWYTIDGRRLPGRPTAKGLYIRRHASGSFGKKIHLR